MAPKAKITRFRAYQLGSAGSSFSYFDGSDFTLIEARLTEMNDPSIAQEMKICGIKSISTLHITSWDQDHCVPSQLERIVNEFSPRKIEYPGYDPTSDTGKESHRIIKGYKKSKTGPASLKRIT